jgi:hypothetical protein
MMLRKENSSYDAGLKDATTNPNSSERVLRKYESLRLPLPICTLSFAPPVETRWGKRMSEPSGFQRLAVEDETCNSEESRSYVREEVGWNCATRDG